MSLEKVYDYFHNYDKQTYQVVACMGNEPSEQDIKDFENQYGINLPADFREFTNFRFIEQTRRARKCLYPFKNA